MSTTSTNVPEQSGFNAAGNGANAAQADNDLMDFHVSTDSPPKKASPSAAPFATPITTTVQPEL